MKTKFLVRSEEKQSDLFGRLSPTHMRWKDVPDEVREEVVQLLAQLLQEKALRMESKND